jgi:cytochrome c-type biogenesis protein
MGELFATLTNAIEGSAAIALTAALIWGILSILLSPCHLASIPLIVGFITQQGKLTLHRAFWISTWFSLGILSTITIIGIITASLGRMAGDIGGYGNYIVAVIFFIVGLSLLDVIPLNFGGPTQVKKTRGTGMTAAFLLGFFFGIALGPCTFAYMAPVLGATFRVGATTPLLAVGLLISYGIGHCSVIVLAGTFTQTVQKYLRWNETSMVANIVKKVCGVFVLFGGLYLIYTAP